MSEYQGHYSQIVKALRDGIPTDDMDYKNLNLKIILNHLFLISLHNSEFSESDVRLLRHLMNEYDSETLALWDL
jgi:hypothetical protein